MPEGSETNDFPPGAPKRARVTILEMFALTQYAEQVARFVVWLVLWGEATALSFVFFWKSSLEAAATRKAKGAATARRTAAALLFLVFFAGSTHALVNTKITIPPSIEIRLGKTAMAENNYRDAVNHFKKAEESGDEDSDFYFNYAEALYMTGYHQEALRVIRRCPRGNFRQEFDLGKILYSLRKPGPALKAFQSAERLNPGSPLAPAWQAETALRLGKKENALAILQKLKRGSNLTPAQRAVLDRWLNALRNPR